MAGRKGNAGLIALTVLITAGVVSGAFVFSGTMSPLGAGAYNQSAFFTGESTGALRKFSSVGEFQAFLSASQSAESMGGFSRYARSGGVASESLGDFQGASVKATGAPSAGNMVTTSTSDYSGTNVQYLGVDEGDFVKTDGSYIYAISNGVIQIIRATDGQMEPVSQIAVESEDGEYSSLREIFVKGNRLFAISESSERGFYFLKYDIMPQEYSRQVTKESVYDITSRENPILLSNHSFSGSYYQSRMIGEKVFIVSNEYPNYYSKPMPPIVFSRGPARTITPEIYYFDNTEDSYQLSTVASFDIETGDFVEAKSFLLGYANTLMVSENAIYVAYQKSRPCFSRFGGWWGGCQYDAEGYERGRFFEVVLPLLQGDLKARIESISAEGLPEDEEWAKISSALSDYFKGMEEINSRGEEIPEETVALFEKIQEALSEYDIKKELENHGTTIHKIAISGETGKIEYKAKGDVPGTLLNQFSLDETGGKLRVATTFSTWSQSSREAVQFNNVYVLDSDMKVTGRLENLAEGERIYSTRFLGDRLYMVTFRQTDPLFVIDLSEDTPKVLGELKIPGFSNYLHPFKDGKYLIGVGRETKEISETRNVVEGVKISVFDVSDVSNPKEVDKEEIGTRETDSSALYEHKAFLFSEGKGGLLSIPISETTQFTEEAPEILPSGKRSPYYYPRYRYRIWTGAYVFSVNESGIYPLGKVEHSSFENSNFYWKSPSTVTRSFYIENALYTVSDKYILSNRLFSLDLLDKFSFSEVKLPSNSPEYVDDELPIEDYSETTESPAPLDELTYEESLEIDSASNSTG